MQELQEVVREIPALIAKLRFGEAPDSPERGVLWGLTAVMLMCKYLHIGVGQGGVNVQISWDKPIGKPTKAGQKKPITYEYNSRKIKSRLEKDGWYVARTQGDHHVMKHPKHKGRIILCLPVKDLPEGTVKKIYKDAGWES